MLTDKNSAINKLIAKLPSSVDAALIVSPENRRYFTGFASTEGVLLATRNMAVLYVDGRYIESAKKNVMSCEVVLKDDLKSQLREHNLHNVAVEADRMTISEGERYRSLLGTDELIDGGELDELINKLRIIKSYEETQKIVKAQRIAEKSWENLLNYIKEGVTEREMALFLEFEMLKNGAEAISFDTIAVSGKNTSMPHGRPSDRKAQKGDFITVDFGAVYDGYHSDMTRTVALGDISEKMEEAYQITYNAQTAGIKAAKSGIACGALDLKARKIIEDAGYGKCFNHALGHGVGMEIHEAPNVSAKSDMILEEGMVITIEPGIYIEGEFGVRIEDMLYITDKGYNNLTEADKTLIKL